MWEAVQLSLKLAFVSTILLLICSTGLCLLLPKRGMFRNFVNAFLFLPLVLPPTVIGFYLLVLFTPSALPFNLAFTFEGLVVGSVIYSLPFVYQPIQNAINSTSANYQDLASTMGAGPVDRFFSVTLPLAKDGFIAAAILGFAHTIGEFGVVLMIGGNIPGETQVLSVLLYEYVEMGDYNSAHKLSIVLLVVSFCLLFLMYRFTGGATGFIPQVSDSKRSGRQGWLVE